jgi:hypothetical protein
MELKRLKSGPSQSTSTSGPGQQDRRRGRGGHGESTERSSDSPERASQYSEMDITPRGPQSTSRESYDNIDPRLRPDTPTQWRPAQPFATREENSPTAQSSSHSFQMRDLSSLSRRPSRSGRSHLQSASASTSSFALDPAGTPPPRIQWCVAPTAFTAAHQKRLEHHIIRLTASADFSFGWTENPYWLNIMDDFIPGASYITRRSLSGPILKRELKEVREDNKRRIAGNMVTLQCDGWTGRNKNHLVAFMVSSAAREEVRYSVQHICGLSLTESVAFHSKAERHYN